MVFITFSSTFTFVAACFSALLLRAIYRLTLHPLARFPGPFWARVSSVYAMTFDFSSRSRGYILELPKLHDKHGPIIRVEPNELHVRDLDAYYQVFRPGTPFDKYKNFYDNEATRGFFNVHSSKDVKPWKDVYQPYFSKAAIGRLEPSIHSQLRTFLSKLTEAANHDKVVDLTFGFRSFASDIVMGYCFADKGFRTIEQADFTSPTLVALEKFFDAIHMFIYFPRMMASVSLQLERLPQSLQKKLVPALAATNWILEQCGGKLTIILKGGGSQSGMPTVFDSWADPALNKKRDWRPTLKQLRADAFTFHAAGADTTANVLTIGIWNVMANPAIRSKLREELVQAIPDPLNGEIVSASSLENLPYLRGVVKESLRLGYGPPGRLPRTVPKTGAVLCGQQIPPGTTITISAYCIHTWEKYFEDPSMFKPERWLGADAAELDRHLISFSRGSRSCIGQNLAQAELYLVLAYMFRIFEPKPYNTVAADIEEWKDQFLPVPRKHLEVKLEVLEK